MKIDASHNDSALDTMYADEITPQQQEQIDYIEMAVENYKKLIVELEMLEPTGIDESISTIIDEIVYHACAPSDYIED